MNNEIRVAVTGHRPSKLWGYDYSHPGYTKLAQKLANTLREVGATHLISGMALGADQVFAMVGVQLRPKCGWTVEAAVPCANHDSKWAPESKQLNKQLLTQVDRVTYVSDKPYTSRCMQDRNIYMVNNCDILIAVWDGSTGGTSNCIKYAVAQDKSVIYIRPQQIGNN